MAPQSVADTTTTTTTTTASTPQGQKSSSRLGGKRKSSSAKTEMRDTTTTDPAGYSTPERPANPILLSVVNGSGSGSGSGSHGWATPSSGYGTSSSSSSGSDEESSTNPTPDTRSPSSDHHLVRSLRRGREALNNNTPTTLTTIVEQRDSAATTPTAVGSLSTFHPFSCVTPTVLDLNSIDESLLEYSKSPLTGTDIDCQPVGRPSAGPPAGSAQLTGIKSLTNVYYNHRGDPIVYRNVLIFIVLHTFALIGIWEGYAYHLYRAQIFVLIAGNVGGLGITAGAHRLWAHKSYKARLPLRIFLMICQTIAGQNDLHEWVRDHRVHHKFTETDADPHNSHRGYFFSHIGWLMTRKHPEVIKKGRQIDMSDIAADPVVAFQRRFYIPLYLIFAMWLPAFSGRLLGLTWWQCICGTVFARYAISLHCTWFVNSAAHMWGDQPYDAKLRPRENVLVSFGALGEGFHNYHHAFPFDYATSEMGWKFNVSTFFIDMMAKCGQAYDLRTMSRDAVASRRAKVAANQDQEHEKDY